MELFEALFSRRSIRKFTQQPVSAKQVQQMLTAAMAAPSAGNAQPWRFVVVTDRALLDALSTINPYTAMAKQAPLAIVVCADLDAEKYKNYWVQDCSAAMQNLLLAAHALHLGAVWTGVHPVQERVAGFSAMFALPENIIPLGIAIIGHPDQHLAAHQDYDANKVHYNQW